MGGYRRLNWQEGPTRSAAAWVDNFRDLRGDPPLTEPQARCIRVLTECSPNRMIYNVPTAGRIEDALTIGLGHGDHHVSVLLSNGVFSSEMALVVEAAKRENVQFEFRVWTPERDEHDEVIVDDLVTVLADHYEVEPEWIGSGFLELIMWPR